MDFNPRLQKHIVKIPPVESDESVVNLGNASTAFEQGGCTKHFETRYPYGHKNHRGI